MISNVTIRLLDYGCCDLCNLCYKPNHPFVKGKGVVETQSLNNCIEVSYNGFLSVKDIGYCQNYRKILMKPLFLSISTFLMLYCIQKI